MPAPGRAGSSTNSSARSTSYDLASAKEHIVPIEIAADLTEVRPRFQNVAREIRDARISPTGVRAVIEAQWRDPDRPRRRKGRYPQPDQHAGRDGADAGVVAGWQVDRIFFRRIGRVRAAYQGAERSEGETAQDRAGGQVWHSISNPQMVARQQAHRVHRQSAESVGSGNCFGKADQGRYWIITTSWGGTSTGRPTPSGLRSQSLCRTACTRSISIRWRTGRPSR